MQIDWSKLFSYINESADKKTIEEAESWRKKDPRNESFYRRACDYYKNDPIRNESFSEEQLDVLYLRMLKGKRRKRQWVLWQRMTVAASIIMLFSVGALWWNSRTDYHKESEGLAAKIDTRHVEEVIVVTENGDKITTGQLNPKLARQTSENKLEYSISDSVEVSDTTRVEKQVLYHTIIVPRGKTFELVLSDGTFVLLSPSSELTYPVQFDSCSTREVTLRGEAFFEVTKSSNRFVVHTNDMKLQVYGTTFNVFSREGTPDETVLLEGVVGITPKNSPGKEETVLHPGDKSFVNKSGRVSVIQTDLAEYVAKRNGYILFNGKTIEEVMPVLELYYDVDFITGGTKLNDKKYVFSVKREVPIREILDIIEDVSDVKFVIEGKEVKVIPK